MSYLSDLGAGLLGIVGANSGLFIPALIAALAYWWKTRQLVRAERKLVLYYLLEINFQFSRSTRLVEEISSNLASRLSERFKSKGLELSPDKVAAELMEEISPQVSGIFEIQGQKLDLLSKNFHEAVNQLAKTDPIMAYRLNGKEAYQNLDNIISDSAHAKKQSIANEVPEQHKWLLSLMTTAMDSSIAFSNKSLAEDLKRDALAVAKSIGPIQYLKCRRVLVHISTIQLADVTAQFDELFDSLISGVVNSEVQTPSSN